MVSCLNLGLKEDMRYGASCQSNIQITVLPAAEHCTKTRVLPCQAMGYNDGTAFNASCQANMHTNIGALIWHPKTVLLQH